MERISNLPGVIGFSSTLHFTNLILSLYEPESSSSNGAMARHGPHQGDPKIYEYRYIRFHDLGVKTAVILFQ